MTDPAELPLHWWSATDLAEAMRTGTVGALEVMSAHLDRIDALDGTLGVMVSRLGREAALDLARDADAARARGEALGPLHGVPIAIKDLADAAGLPTSRGSRAFAGSAPASTDAPFVRRLRTAGAIVVGKTNLPEYGVGTLTVNDVVGVTRNPWDTTRHAGGSTGGAAALAAGMLPLVDGSDSGGSLRYPASFLGVVGLRPTPGLIGGDATATAWEPHAVQGPMARSSRDAALMLTAMSGAVPESPLSWGREPTAPLGPPRQGRLRLGWSADLDGVPVAAEVRAVLAAARATLAAADVEIVDVDLPLADADEAWETIEMLGFHTVGGADALARPRLYSEDFVRNVAEGAAVTPERLARALAARHEIFRRTATALEGLDGIVAPATPIPAPPADLRHVLEVDGVSYERYHGWQRLACRLTMTCHPVLVTPAGFTAGGLPVGMQIVGHLGRDVDLLAVGDAIERRTPWSARRPDL